MASADPATLPWTALLPHILSSAQEEDYEESSRLCLAFLNANSGASSDANEDAAPPDVLSTVRTTYARSLLQLEDYPTLIEYCKAYRQATSSSGGGSGGGSASATTPIDERFHLRQEEAYAYYRLKNYTKARDVCRSTLTSCGFDANDLNQPVEGDELIPLGLVHVYAQSFYRLNQTEVAKKVYQYLMQNVSSRGGGEDEAGEVMTNSLANVAANATYSGSKSGLLVKRADKNEIQELITSGEDYNYDLARNHALTILLGATSASDLHRVIGILDQARDGARTMLEEDSGTQDEIAEEVAPILVDIATTNQMLGDRQAASRSYLELMRSAGSSNGGGADAIRFVAKHNLAVLTSATNPAAAIKQMPTMEDGTATKLTAAQIRNVMFNRALLALGNKKHVDCRQALATLKGAIAGTSGKKPNKKGGQDGGASAAMLLSAPPANAADVAIWSSRIALVESELLRAENKTDEATAALQSAIDALANVERSLEDDYSDDADSKREAVQFGLAALSLHKLEVERTLNLSRSEDEDGAEEKEEEASGSDPIDVLSNLPASIKTRPAVLGAISALHSQAGREDKVAEIVEMLSSSSRGTSGADAESAKIKSAQFIKSGRYKDAIAVLRSALDADDDLPEETHLDLTARLVQALSHVDPAEAEELASTLDSGETFVLPDGEELEGRETPLLGKGGGGGVARKVGGASSVAGKESQEKKKKKREATLRRRAKKREAYLEKLESEGRYNPDRPSKPDPERWIPKAQRSYARRGRRGRQRFVGAQGGGTGAGADRDAARLDAAARAAAKRDGTASGTPSKPSTAHMEVSSGGPSRRKGGRR